MSSIDLRSDTVTRPTPAMREAMALAEVGDDVFGEDPEANRLQARAAELLGKEAALFVPSGTMANQVAVSIWTRPGDVVLAGEHAHLLLYEGGAAAALSGCQITTLGRGGLFDAADVHAAAAPDEQHHAPTTLVSVENTHNYAGGVVFPLERIRA
ncbi:MAG: threonine aldolase family protein, partial [Actinomycetota bacterium]|nr:threonine aldolase family protein [Actinomycetota bacterium]